MSVELETHAGGRIGWWLVTGPDDPKDVYGQVELSRTYHDAEMYSDFFWWGLYVRRAPERNNTDPAPIDLEAQGRALSLDDAVDELAKVWPARWAS